MDPSHHPTGLGRSNLTGLTSSGLTGLQSYGLSGPGGLAGGGYSGLGVGGYSASTGFTGLGGGLTGMGSGLTGLGGGLTGLSGGLNLTSSSPPSYSPYSTTYPGQVRIYILRTRASFIGWLLCSLSNQGFDFQPTASNLHITLYMWYLQ